MTDLERRVDDAARLSVEVRIRELGDIRTELIRRYLAARGNGADPKAAAPEVPYYPMRRTEGHDDRLVLQGRSYLADEEFRAIETERRGTVTQESALRLLHRIQWLRALAYLDRGDKAGFVAELAPPRLGGWTLENPSRASAPALSCAAGDALCERARKAFDELFPNTCHEERSGGTYCKLDVDSSLVDYDRPTLAAGAFIDAIATQVEREGSGWRIRGTTSGPYKDQLCEGQYQTDKVIGITSEYIEVERTTWCKKIVQSTIKGVDVVFHVKQHLAAEPRIGDSFRFFVEPKRVSVHRGARITEVAIRDAFVTEISIPAGYRYRWSQSLDWQLGQPYRAAKIDQGVIQATLRSHAAAIGDCMNSEAHREHWSGSHTVALQFRIAANGTVSDVSAPDGDAELASCFGKAMADVRFFEERNRQPITVRYPLVYAP